MALCVLVCGGGRAAPPSPRAPSTRRELQLTPIVMDSKTNALAYILAKANIAKELAKLFPTTHSLEDSYEATLSGDEWDTRRIQAKHIEVPSRQKHTKDKYQENSDKKNKEKTKHQEQNKLQEKNEMAQEGNKDHENKKGQESDEKYQDTSKYEELSTLLDKQNIPEEVISLLSHLNDDKTKDSKHNHIVVLKHMKNGKQEDSQVHNIIKENLNALQDDLSELNAQGVDVPIIPLADKRDVTSAGANLIHSMKTLQAVPIHIQSKESRPVVKEGVLFEDEFNNEVDSYLVDSTSESEETLAVSELDPFKVEDNSNLVDSSSESSHSLEFDTNDDFQFNFNGLHVDKIPVVINTPNNIEYQVNSTEVHEYGPTDSVHKYIPNKPDLIVKPKEFDYFESFEDQLIAPLHQDPYDVAVTSQKMSPKNIKDVDVIQAVSEYNPLHIPVAIVQEPVDDNPNEYDHKADVILDRNIDSIPVAVVQEPVDIYNNDHNIDVTFDSNLKSNLPQAQDHKFDRLPSITDLPTNFPLAYEYEIEHSNDPAPKPLERPDVPLATQHNPLDASDAGAVLPPAHVKFDGDDILLPTVKELHGDVINYDTPAIEGKTVDDFISYNTSNNHNLPHSSHHHHHHKASSKPNPSIEEQDDDVINHDKNHTNTHIHKNSQKHEVSNHVNLLAKEDGDFKNHNISDTNTNELGGDVINNDTLDDHMKSHSSQHHHKGSIHHEPNDDTVFDDDVINEDAPDYHKIPHLNHHRGHQHSSLDLTHDDGNDLNHPKNVVLHDKSGDLETTHSNHLHKGSNHNDASDSTDHNDNPTSAHNEVPSSSLFEDLMLTKLEEILSTNGKVSDSINPNQKYLLSSHELFKLNNILPLLDATKNIKLATHVENAVSPLADVPASSHAGILSSLLDEALVTSYDNDPSSSHEGGIPLLTNGGVPISLLDFIPMSPRVPPSSHSEVDANIPISSQEVMDNFDLHTLKDILSQSKPRTPVLPTATGSGYDKGGSPITTGGAYKTKPHSSSKGARHSSDANDVTDVNDSCEENIQQQKYYQLSFIFNK